MEHYKISYQTSLNGSNFHREEIMTLMFPALVLSSFAQANWELGTGNWSLSRSMLSPSMMDIETASGSRLLNWLSTAPASKRSGFESSFRP